MNVSGASIASGVSAVSQKDGELLSFDEQNAMLQSLLESMPQPLQILEAGCGRYWPLRLSVPYTLTGIDADPDALAARSDLRHAILGDLRSAEFPPQSFDVIYCSFVLEHVSGAQQVLERFERWLKPKGVLIIKVPDRNSAFGFVTRVTPFWFHVAYYRYVVGYKTAGTPGHGPYRTYYDEVISQSGLRRFCDERGLRGLHVYRLCSYVRQRLVVAAAFVIWMLTAGKLPWRHNYLLIIIRREAQSPA
jgi:SAM-dependent methyltransferase